MLPPGIGINVGVGAGGGVDTLTAVAVVTVVTVVKIGNGMSAELRRDISAAMLDFRAAWVGLKVLTEVMVEAGIKGMVLVVELLVVAPLDVVVDGVSVLDVVEVEDVDVVKVVTTS